MLDQPSKLRGEWSMQTSQSHGNFIIYQEKTAGNAWTLWRKANKLWSHPSGEFKQPLGDWVINSMHAQSQRHFCFWARHHIWIRVEPGYIRCDPTNDKHHSDTGDFSNDGEEACIDYNQGFD